MRPFSDSRFSLRPGNLLNALKRYGPVTLKPGYESILVSPKTPNALKERLSSQFYDVQALLEEWQCPESDSPIIASAERIIRNERPPDKAKRRTKPRRRTPSQMPLL